MKKAVFVYQIPVVPGVPYAPILSAAYSTQAKKYLKVLETKLIELNMDWQIVLDDSSADLNVILSEDNDLLIFPPGAKTRCWMYKKQLEKSGKALYFLEAEDYQNKAVNKLVNFTSNLETETV